MKKFLSYILTFALLFFISAAATVSMATGNDNLINPNINNSQQASSSSLFNGILDTFSKQKKLNVKGYLNLKNDENVIPVNIYIDVDISDTNNIKVNGYLNIKYEGNSNVIEFAFYNSTIYLSFENNNIKISMQTISDLIDEITNLLPSNNSQSKDNDNYSNDIHIDSSNSSSSESDLSSEETKEKTDILESLMPMLMDALDNMKETTLENGYKRIELSLDKYLDVVLVTNNDNEPKSVEFETANFKGYELYANLDIEFNDELTIYNPETKNNRKDYFDLRSYKELVTNLFNINNFASNINLELNGRAVKLNVLANLSKKYYDVKLIDNDFGYVDDLQFIFKENDIYLNMNDMFLKIDKSLISKVGKLVDNSLENEFINLDLITEKLFGLIKSINVEKLNIKTALGLLSSIKSFTINENELLIKIDSCVLGLEIGTIDLKINYIDNKLNEISIKGINFDDNQINLELKINETEKVVGVETPERYLNVYDLVKNNKEYFTSTAYSLDLDLLFSNKKELFTLDSVVQFDFQSRYLYTDLLLGLNNEGIPLEVEYIGGLAYVKYNNIKLKMSKKQAEDLIKELGFNSKQNINLEHIIGDFSLDINEETILLAISSIKNIEVTGNQVKLEIGLGDFGFDLDSRLTVVLEDAIIKQVVINATYEESCIYANVSVLDNKVTEKQINSNEYLDIVSFANSFGDLFDIKEGQISIGASLSFDNKEYFVNLDILGSLNKEYLKVYFGLTGDASFDLNLDYYDNIAYVNLNDIFIKSKLTSVLSVFSLFKMPSKENIEGLLKNQEIVNLSSIESGFDLSLLENIKEVSVSSSEIKLILSKDLFGLDQDLTFIVTLTDNKFSAITINNFSANGVAINGTIAVQERFIDLQKVSEEKYLDIEAFVKNTFSLLSSNILNISLQADLHSSNYELLSQLDLNFGKLFENNQLLLNLFANLVYDEYKFDINGIYQDNTTFVDFNGLKLMLETDRLYETVSRILTIINENPKILNKVILKIENLLNVGDLSLLKDEIINNAKNSLKLSTKDLIKIVSLIVSKLNVSSSGVSIELNGYNFGYDGIVDLEILLDGNNVRQILINKLKIDEYYLDVNLSVNTSKQTLEQVSKTEKVEYINVAELSEVVESAYNTIKTKSITGLATVKFNYNNKQILLNINYGFKLDKNNQLVVYLSTTLIGKKIDVYFANNTLYVDVQGLKTKIDLNEIPELIDWLNSEFNLGIDLTKLDTSEIENKIKDIYFILGVVNNMDISSVLDRIEFGENSMEIIIDKDSSIFVNYNSLLDQVIVNENGKYFELNLETKIFTLNEIDFNGFVSYESIIDAYNSVINTLNTENNYLFNLSLNINNNNVSALVQIDKDYNIQVSLTNNTFGFAQSLIITYIDGELYLKLNDVYVLVTEELISKMPSYLAEIISMFKLEGEVYKLYNFILEQKLNVKKFNPLVIVDYLEYISLTSNGVSVTFNSRELKLGNEIVVSLIHNKKNVTSVSIRGLQVKDNILGLSVGISETTEDVCVQNSQKYNDIYRTILNNIDYFNKGAIDFTIVVTAIINNEKIPALANVKFDIKNNYIGINLFIDYKTGYSVNIELIQGEIYLTVNNTKTKISQKQLMEIIYSLDLSEVYKFIGNAYNSVEKTSSEVSYKDIILKTISTVEYITLDSNEISVKVCGEELGLQKDAKLNILLENSVVKTIKLSEIKLDKFSVWGNITINSNIVAKNIINTEEYIDVVNLANKVDGILNSTQGEINLDVNADIYNKNYILELDLKGSLENQYLDLTALLSGGYNLFANLTLIDGKLYAQINNMFVKADFKTILGLILSQCINKDDVNLSVLENLDSIINVKDFINNFDLLDLYVIKNIKANNEYIEIIIDKSVIGGANDLVINITLDNNLPKKLTISNLYIDSNIQVNSLSLTFEEKEVQENIVNTNSYLDLEDTINKASKLPYLNDLNAILNVDLYKQVKNQFEYEVGFEFDYSKHIDSEGELWDLIFSIIGKENVATMSATYQNQSIFAEYNGLKLMLETTEIQNIVSTILSMIGIENNYTNIVSRVVTFLEGKGLVNALSGLNLPNISLSTNEMVGLGLFAIENINLSSNQLYIEINGKDFGYDGTISLVINFVDNNISSITISKLKVNDVYIDISLTLSLEEQTIETVLESEQEFYINVDKLTEAIEAGYKTITQDYVTGHVNLSTVLFDEDVDLTVFYGIGNNNGTFKVYVETEYKGIGIKIVYQNGALYVDIQGMKIQIALDNINSLINWIEDQFGVKIDEKKLAESIKEVKQSLPSTTEDFIKFLSNIDLSFINKVVFEEKNLKSFLSSNISKTMIVELTNGMIISFGYSEKVQDIAMVSEEVDISAKIDDVPDNAENYNPVIETEEFTSYTYLTELITLLKQTILSDKNFSLGLNINTNKGELGLNALLDVNNFETHINLIKNTFGYIESADIFYKDGNIYLKVNDLYILLSEDLISNTPDLLDSLFNEFGIETSVNGLVDSLKEKISETANINPVDYLKYIENVDIKPNKFRIEVNANILGLGDYLVVIYITHNDEGIENIRVSGFEFGDTHIDLTLKVRHTEEHVTVSNEEQYIDTYKVAKENIEFFKTGELDLDVNVEIDSVADLLIKGNIKLDLNNKEFGLRLNITGDYNLTLELDYYNDTAYVVINGIKVQATLDKVQELLKEFGINIDVNSEINSMLNSTSEIDVTINEVWNAIEKLMLKSNGLELNFNLGVFDINSCLDASINIEDLLAKEIILNNFNINGNIINAVVTVNNNSVNRNEINEEDYLDIVDTVFKTEELLFNKNLTANLSIDIFNEKLNNILGLEFEYKKLTKNEQTIWALIAKVMSGGYVAEASLNYQNQALFAEYNGLKLMLETEKLQELVNTIFYIIEMNNSYGHIVGYVEQILEGNNIVSVLKNLELPQVDVKVSELLPVIIYTLDNLVVSSNSLEIIVDGKLFGYDEDVNLIINFEDNYISEIIISKLKVGDIYLDISLDLSLEKPEIEKVENEENYININKLVEFVKAGYNTVTQEYITGTIQLNTELFEEMINLEVNYGVGYNNGFEVYIETEFKGINLALIYKNETLYLNIQGMMVQIKLDEIDELISWIETEFNIDINEKAADELAQEFNKKLPTTIEEVVKLLSELDLDLINKVIFNGSEMVAEFNNGLELAIEYSEKLETIECNFENINVLINIDDRANISVNYEDNTNLDSYTSYESLTRLVSIVKELAFNDKFNIKLDVNFNEFNVKLNALLDINNLNLYANLINHNLCYVENLEVVYIENNIYLKVNDLYILISEELIKDCPELLKEFGLELDSNELTQKFETKLSEINVLDYLKYFENITLTDNSLLLNVNAQAFGLGNYLITLEIKFNNELENINISNVIFDGNSLDLTVNVKETEYEVSINNPEQYVDIYNVIKENYEFFKTGELDLDVNVELDSELDLVVNGNIKLDLNNKEFGLRLNITGDYNLTLAVDYYDNAAYVVINGIKVQTTLDKVQELLKDFGINIDVNSEINSMLNSTSEIDVTINEVWNAIERLMLKSNGLELNFNLNAFDINSILDLIINIENSLVKELLLNDFNINGNIINAVVTVNNNSVTRNEINEEDYLDILDAVNKAEELIYNKNLNALLNFDIYNEDLEHEISFEFDYKKLTENEQTIWSLLANIVSGGCSLEVGATYQDNVMFTEFNGLKLMLETNKLQELVNSICYIVGINNSYSEIVGYAQQILEGNNIVSVLNNVQLPAVNVKISEVMPFVVYALDNLVVNSDSLEIIVDGSLFGYDGEINLVVKFENNYISEIVISKLKVGDIYLDISLDLSSEKPEIEKVENKENYININKLVEFVKVGYNTVTQEYITGTIQLNTELFEEMINLEVNYGVGYNKGFEVYVETEFKGINSAVIYKNEAIYLNIQGMMIEVKLNEIENLISWIEEEFNIDINENQLDELTKELNKELPTNIEEVIKLVSEIDLSFINIQFNDSEMVVSFKEIDLLVNYSDKLENIEFNFEGINASVIVDDEVKHSEKYETNMKLESYVSYESLTRLVSIVKKLINNNKFDVNLNVNFNDINVNLNALLDINNLSIFANIAHNLGYVDNVEIVYIGNNIYLKANDLYILVSEELIKDCPEILKEFGLELNTNSLTEKIESSLSEINILDYLKYLENITLTDNSLLLNVNAQAFGLGDYLITLEIKFNNELENINISNVIFDGNSLDLTVNVKETEDEVSINNPEQYVDIYKAFKENYEFFKTGELDLDVEFEIDSVVDLLVKGNIKLDLNNKEFGLRLDITGDYNLTLELDYYNETAYVVINGIKVQTTLDKVQELLKEFGLEFNTEAINSMLNSTSEIDVTINEVWNAIEKLMLTSNGLELNFNLKAFEIDSILDLVINIENNLVKELILNNFNINGNIINANVVINNNSVERNEINEEEYLDLTETVVNAKELINKNVINLLADIKLYDSELNQEFGLSLDLSKIFENGNLNAKALINLLYNNKEFSIDTIYQNNAWFANIQGLKLMLEKDRIEETVQTILSIIGLDIHSYDEIINRLIPILEGESLYNLLSDINIDVSNNINELDYELIIKEILKNIEISSTEIKLSIDGNIFGYDSLINVLIKLENNNIVAINIDKLKLGDKFVDVSIKISEEREEIENVSNEDKESYVNLAEFAKVAKATLKTFESKTISGFFTLGFTFAGERNLLNVNYGICFDKDKGYEGYIQTNFKGLDVNIYFIDNKIYLDIIGLKIHLSFEDMNGLVEWLTKFGVELDFDFTSIEKAINGETKLMPKMDISEILDIVFGLDLSLINKAIFNENSLEAIFNGGLNIFVNYTDVVNQVIFQDGDIYVELNCTDFNNFALDINKEEFNSYLIVTDMVDATLELLKKKQVSMDAETLVYENNILADRVDIDLDINTLNTLNVYADVIVNNDKNTNINFAYQDDYIFANYKNLKLSLSQKSLKELLVIVLEALGVDAKTIGFLGNVAEDMNLDTDNLKEIMPNLDFGNPLNMLKLVKSINIVNGEFIIIVDGAGLTGVESSDDMTLKVKASNGDISTIKLGNVYSNGEKQRFDLNINFIDYSGVKQITDKSSYVDISGSAGILKAFVNTSYLTDYSIKGTITVIANVIGINIDMDIPVEARIKLVDGKPVAYIVMDVPVIGSNVPGFTGINVNNDVPYEFGDTSVDSRRLEIMYKDDFIYFYRKDVVKQTVFANRTYEKTLKLNANEMTADLVNYLLSYGLGFSDAIMAEIDKAIVKATDRADNPLDVSNILKGFSHTDNTDLYSILINLAEIANNELLGDALINIYTVNNASTNNKDYIGKLAFDINMPLASVCEINLETNDLTLNNIGQTVDVSNVDSYVNNYQFKENQQYEKSGGNWEFAGEKQYTIKFIDSKGNTVNDIVAPVDTAITLPSLSTIVETKADGEYTYTFAGWYLSEDFKESNKVSYTTMPRGNRTLYAKWNESIKYNRTVTLNSMGGEQDSAITGLEGSRFILPTLENMIVVDGQTKITYGFTGWFKNESCTERATIYEIPSEDITLYAGWEEISRYVAYNLKVIDNGAVVFNEFIGEGLDIELSGFTMDSYTKFYLTQDYTNEYTIGKMPSNDLTLYVRNRYALNIVSAYGSVYDTTEYHYQGETYNLPSQSNYVVDDGNTRVTYTFNGWEGKTSVMPNSNLRVVASWSIVTKHYYDVTFNLAYNGNAAYYKHAKLYKNGTYLGSNEITVRVLEGNMNLNEYSADWKYTTGSWIFTVNWYYDFQGFSTSKDGSAMSTVNITGNTTIYGLWSGLKS